MRTPLGEVLTGEATQPKRRRWVVIAFAALALTLLVGAAAAASISINSDTPIEFGQGRELATACDQSIDAEISTTSFGSTIENLAFRVGSLKFTNVDLVACSDKVFTVTFRRDDGTATGACFATNETGAVAGSCASPEYHNAGDAIVKFSFSSCDTYGDCDVTYYGNPVETYGGGNGIGSVITNVVDDVEVDGFLTVTIVWGAADTFVGGTQYFLVRADQVSGVTVETS
jgi:hypothetical protein